MKTLYLRIVVTTLLFMIISSLLAFFLSNAYYQYYLKSFNDQKVTHMALNVQNYYQSKEVKDIDSYLKNVGILGYQMYLTNGKETGTFFGDPFRNKELSLKVIQDVLSGNVYHGISKYPSKPFNTGFFEDSLINTIGVPLVKDGEQYALFIRPNVEVQFGEMRFFFAVLLVITVVLSILFVAISTRYIVKPIIKLSEATKQIAKGDYNIQLQTNRSDEIGQLAAHFSKMTKSLENLEEMRQEFVSNVSHELQTPLASIQGFSQTLKAETLTEDQRKEYLSIIENESRRLSLLSKQLLTLASLDKDKEAIEMHTFDVADQIKQVLFLTEWNWREKELAMDLDIPSTFIHGDQRLLHQVWTNLLTNCIKFTEHGGTISIQLSEVNRVCHIDIKDSGIGIDETDLPNIFNRFYKADKSRSRKEGSGLGLAISKKIIEMHNGTITAESTLGKGTTFHIRLPQL
ncbi:sensor histidine kinase [Peribacillus alkalitolerans]|uniref:sensor histidine kinase n=1 Tax=Peribacillus alkalitolerans TaxID=1550385 RepID=UPI0013D1B3AC|nr:HAMP domain-containing sensor histidine kinase [Peribacillus alkalitolerans]